MNLICYLSVTLECYDIKARHSHICVCSFHLVDFKMDSIKISTLKKEMYVYSRVSCHSFITLQSQL